MYRKAGNYRGSATCRSSALLSTAARPTQLRRHIPLRALDVRGIEVLWRVLGQRRIAVGVAPPVAGRRPEQSNAR